MRHPLFITRRRQRRARVDPAVGKRDRTAGWPFSRPMDPGWHSFTARMIVKFNATVPPLYFEGHISLMFRIASHMRATSRMGLLIRQFSNRVDTPVRLPIGERVGRDLLDPLAKDRKAMMDFLRKATYELFPDPEKSFDPEYEFEERHRG